MTPKSIFRLAFFLISWKMYNDLESPKLLIITWRSVNDDLLLALLFLRQVGCVFHNYTIYHQAATRSAKLMRGLVTKNLIFPRIVNFYFILNRYLIITEKKFNSFETIANHRIRIQMEGKNPINSKLAY